MALGAHRLGAAVDLLIASGKDSAGDALLLLLQREGMDATHVHRLGAHSGQGCGLISAQGDSSVTVFAGANALLSERELQPAIADVRQAAVVYAQLEAPLPTVRAALQLGRAAGAVTVLNASPWPVETQAARPAEWSAALAATCVLVVNRTEAVVWLGEMGEGLADVDLTAISESELTAIWREWPKGEWLVITLGAQGCVAYGRDGSVHRVPGHALVCTQPVGAGDAFSAGLCAALASGV